MLRVTGRFGAVSWPPDEVGGDVASSDPSLGGCEHTGFGELACGVRDESAVSHRVNAIEAGSEGALVRLDPPRFTREGAFAHY